MKKELKIRGFVLIFSLILIGLDQISKLFIKKPGCFLIFCVSPSINYGGAFSLPIAMIILLIVSIIVALVSLILIFLSKSIKIKLALGFIFAGTLGNLIDRVFLRHVRDFLVFSFSTGLKFNFADVFNIIGVLLLIIFLCLKIEN